MGGLVPCALTLRCGCGWRFASGLSGTVEGSAEVVPRFWRPAARRVPIQPSVCASLDHSFCCGSLHLIAFATPVIRRYSLANLAFDDSKHQIVNKHNGQRCCPVTWASALPRGVWDRTHRRSTSAEGKTRERRKRTWVVTQCLRAAPVPAPVSRHAHIRNTP